MFGRTENEFLYISKCSEGRKMDFQRFRSVRKDRKWIFIHSERLGSLENEFLYISSRSERAKMDFQRFRVARKGFFFQSTNSFGFIYIYPPNIYGKLLFRQSQQVDLLCYLFGFMQQGRIDKVFIGSNFLFEAKDTAKSEIFCPLSAIICYFSLHLPPHFSSKRVQYDSSERY